MENFKEDYLFNIYKDKHVHSAKFLIAEIKKDYGIEVDNQLHRRIINYQVEKYGGQLQYGGSTDFIPPKRNRNHNHRMKDIKNNSDAYELNKFLERNGY